MTGLEAYRDFCNRVGMSYSDFADKTKVNRLFRRALNKIILKKAFTKTQKEYDELNYLVRTEKPVPIRNNKFHVGQVPISNVTVSGNVVTVTTFSEHNIQSGDSITISDVDGIVTIPVINDTWQVFGVPSAFTFELAVNQAFGTYTPNSGLMTSRFMLIDYMHLYAMRCKSEKELPYKIFRVSQGGIIDFTGRGNLRDGDLINISNYNPLPQISGEWYVKYITNKKVKLFSDILLTTPMQNSLAANASGGVIKQIFYNYADPISSDMKIGDFVRGSNDSAKYESADGLLKIYPKEITFTEATVDYFAKPVIAIDANDNTVDLLKYYQESLLNKILDEAAVMYASPSHDPALEASNMRQQQSAP